MITFQCTCHHRFEVADDQAGADIQCPQCGRLNTVPLANEIGQLAEDGTYQVDGPVGPEQEHPEVAAELARIYRHSRVDELGNEIDLRSHATPLDYQRVGVDPLDLTSESHQRPTAPKYDPETGELIRPVEVSKPVPAVRTALPAGRPLRVRVAVERLENVAPARVFAAMFKPPNLIVLAILAAAHVFLFIVMISATAMWITLPLSLFTVLALIAHYGNVIDETGPSSQDELPRPLRNLSWSDDLWGPFWGFCLMAIVCYGPAWLALRASIPNPALHRTFVGILLAAGTFVAPAVLLSTQTSGSWVNLWPPRVFGTIAVLWRIYPLLVVLFLLSVPVYAVGLLMWILAAELLTARVLADIAQITPPPLPGFFGWIGILVACYGGMWMMHYFGWVLGHVYRVYHRQLPWAYQGPLRENEAEPRGFAVVAPKRRAKNAPTPVAAIPISEPTKDSH